jgi:hypothetical protein
MLSDIRSRQSPISLNDRFQIIDAPEADVRRDARRVDRNESLYVSTRMRAPDAARIWARPVAHNSSNSTSW